MSPFRQEYLTWKLEQAYRNKTVESCQLLKALFIAYYVVLQEQQLPGRACSPCCDMLHHLQLLKLGL